MKFWMDYVWMFKSWCFFIIKKSFICTKKNIFKNSWVPMNTSIPTGIIFIKRGGNEYHTICTHRYPLASLCRTHHSIWVPRVCVLMTCCQYIFFMSIDVFIESLAILDSLEVQKAGFYKKSSLKHQVMIFYIVTWFQPWIGVFPCLFYRDTIWRSTKVGFWISRGYRVTIFVIVTRFWVPMSFPI